MAIPRSENGEIISRAKHFKRTNNTPANADTDKSNNEERPHALDKLYRVAQNGPFVTHSQKVPNVPRDSVVNCLKSSGIFNDDFITNVNWR